MVICGARGFFGCHTWCSDAPCVMYAKILGMLCKNEHIMSSTQKVMSSSCQDPRSKSAPCAMNTHRPRSGAPDRQSFAVSADVGTQAREEVQASSSTSRNSVCRSSRAAHEAAMNSPASRSPYFSIASTTLVREE